MGRRAGAWRAALGRERRGDGAGREWGQATERPRPLPLAALGSPAQLLSSDPRALFNISGTGRYDAVLETATGVLSLLAYIEATGRDADIT